MSFHLICAGDLVRPMLTGAFAYYIRTDMFQELLLADLVVADLSIDNPNVWYELDGAIPVI